MGPTDAEEVEGAVVVVVGGFVVVVVDGVVVVVGGLVVVVAVPPPPPLPPDPEPDPVPPPPPVVPDTAVIVAVVVVVVGEIDVMVAQRLTSPENWLLLESEASVRTTSERTEFESLPPNAEAEASMFTIARSAPEATRSVTTLGIRFVVFERKKFLSEPLNMGYKFAASNHTPGYSRSIVPQFILRSTKSIKSSSSRGESANNWWGTRARSMD
jgi:hypothetical protein